VAAPVRVRIPSIGVRSPLERLGRARDGTVEVPQQWDRAGWYTGGFRPGQPGPAVLLGHVDSGNAPAVFYDLRTLRPGAMVLVDRADKTTVRFRVTSVQQYRKTRFPSDLVYFPTLEPSLRLVTCGGSFDASTGHYRDNVIVLATAA
jgi:sortase (surface protein transpeptidase)